MANTHRTSNETGKTLAAYHQDGLVDLFTGLVAVLAGVGFLTDLPYLGGIAPAILLPVWQSLRQKVTRPRLGSQDQPRLLAIFSVGGLLAGLLLLVAVIFLLQDKNPSWRSWMQQYILIVMGVILSILIAAIGGVMGIRRFYAYSGLLLLLFGAGHKLEANPGLILFLFGLLIASSGTAILVRFIQTYPIQSASQH